jgi:hypothetical protein
LERERPEVVIVFGEMIRLKFDLIKLFYMKGLSQKIGDGTCITALLNVLDVIEQDKQNFFQHAHSAMCSEEAIGEMVQSLINYTRKAFYQIFSNDFLQFKMFLQFIYSIGRYR